MATPNDKDGQQRPRLPRSGASQKKDNGSGSGNSLIWIIAGLLLALFAWTYLGGGPIAGDTISYSAFRQQVQANNVERVTVQGQEIEGELKTPAMRAQSSGDSTSYESFTTYIPSFGDEGLMETLESNGVEVVTEPQSDFPWSLIIFSLLPIFILLGIGWLFLRRMQSQGQGLFSVRKSKAKLYDRDDERTTFEDVAGAEGAKEELTEIIGFLKDPQRYERLGGKVPKGVLMVGPPGTGKTLLARAVAGEADVPFFSVSGSDFMEMFVGVGASRVRDMFEEAKKASPSIIFVDEIDSIGRQRGAGLGGGHDEREQTLNQLLSELDGFEKSETVVVMAATNRPDILDPALTRPGRFDRQITVPLPTKSARHEILKIHARNKPMADDVDLERVAASSPGFSGADLENLLNEAALLAGRYDRDAITRADIEEARDKVIMGLKREGMSLDEEERRLLAYHEAGHAIVAATLPNADPVHKVTIVPRGQAMGVTQQLPEKEKYIYRREYVLDRLAVVMGGRAAEELVFDTATSGAENDLKQVRQMARKMVLDWGMGDRFKHIALGEDRGQPFLGEQITRSRNYSEETAREVDDEVRAITENAFRRAADTLQEYQEAFDKLADLLLEQEEVPGEKVLELVGGSKEALKKVGGSNGAVTHAQEEANTDDAHDDAQNGASQEGESSPGDGSATDAEIKSRGEMRGEAHSEEQDEESAR